MQNKTYVCPECYHTELVDMDFLIDKGEPVCPECDTDMKPHESDELNFGDMDKKKTDYNCWGVSELVEKCENSELFARECAEYWTDKGILNEVEIYLLEKARKLGGLK